MNTAVYRIPSTILIDSIGGAVTNDKRYTNYSHITPVGVVVTWLGLFVTRRVIQQESTEVLEVSVKRGNIENTTKGWTLTVDKGQNG